MAKRKMGFNPDESKKIHDFLDNFAQDNEGRKTEIPLQDAILENTNLIMKLYLTLIVIVHRASKNDHSLAEEICNELDELAVLLDNKNASHADKARSAAGELRKIPWIFMPPKPSQ